MSDIYFIECPHCQINIMIHRSDIACSIFRCGVYRHNGMAIPPHSNKTMCEELVSKGLIYGCGKPFKFNGTIIEICDYI